MIQIFKAFVPRMKKVKSFITYLQVVQMGLNLQKTVKSRNVIMTFTFFLSKIVLLKPKSSLLTGQAHRANISDINKGSVAETRRSVVHFGGGRKN